MNVLFIALISFLISFTWIFYFYKIDLFELEKKHHLIITFLLGTAIPFSIYPIHDYVYDPLGISNSEDPVYSFLFFVFGVGFLEEVIKFIPVLLVFFLFKKAINEPLDYVKYICISALGFAFGENIEYALHYGGYVLLGRSILSVPAHMFFSSIFIYGLMEYKYDNKSWHNVVQYMFLGMLAHGMYDFLLSFESRLMAELTNVIFFMIVISAFANILNNCLNLSPFYSPKKTIDQQKIRMYLFRFYMGIIFSILIFTTVVENIETTIYLCLWFLFWEAWILYILIVRLSRFSIISNHKAKIRIKFPFYVSKSRSQNDMRFLFGLFVIRGESYNDSKISSLYDEEIMILPVSLRKSYLNKKHDGRIENKVYENGNLYYLLRLYLDQDKISFKNYVLMPKKEGLSFNADGNPIVSLNEIIENDGKKLYFREWVILKKK